MKKSLLDIQQEIRGLEEDVKNIYKRIQSLNADIGELRNTDEITADIDFKAVERMAKNIQFSNHPLSRINDEYIKKAYLRLLLCIVQADMGSESTLDRLVMIQWIQRESRIDTSLEELLADTLEMTENSYAELTEVIPEDLHIHLILDALIVANIRGQANEQIMTYIVTLASIFGMDKKRLRELSVASTTVLKQDIDVTRQEDFNAIKTWSKYLEHYLGKNFVEKWLEKYRSVVLKVRTDSFCTEDFRWKVPQRSKVSTGQIIAIFKEYNVFFALSGRYNEYKEIKADRNGTLFQFEQNDYYYGVISCEFDDLESIKKWVKKEEISSEYNNSEGSRQGRNRG